MQVYYNGVVMNTNPSLPQINNIPNFRDAISDKSFEGIKNQEEKDWIGKALDDIKNPQKAIKCLQRITPYVEALNSYTPEQIIHLVSLLDQGIKRESNSQEVINDFSHNVAAIIIKKGLHSFESFLQTSNEKNYAIQVMIQLVKEGQLEPLEAVEKLQNYGIDSRSSTGQRALIQIAKLAQQNGEDVSKFIKKYGIDASTLEGQQALIHIAKLEAYGNGIGISRYIHNFGLDTSKPEVQRAQIEIAKIAAQQDGGGTSANIKNYKIDAKTAQGQQALIEIAMIAAQQDAEETAYYLKQYDIDAKTPTGQEAVIEIAKKSRVYNPDIDPSIPEGQKVLIEIAKKSAQEDGRRTSEDIKKYEIDPSTKEGQQALIEIAKIAAHQNGKGTSEYFQEYGIDPSTPEGQQALIEIAKIAAKQDGKGTSKYIEKYRIDPLTPGGRQALFEIAEIGAQQNANGVLKYLENYSLKTETHEDKQRFKELSKLLFICLVKQFNPFKYSEFKKTFQIYADTINGNGSKTFEVDPTLFEDELEILYAHDMNDAYNKSIFTASLEFEVKPKDLQWVQNVFSQIKNEAAQEEFLEWWMSLAALCSSREDLKKLFIENSSLFEKISSLSPEIRARFTQEIIASSWDTKGQYQFMHNLKAELSKEPSIVSKMAVLPPDLGLAAMDVFIQECQGQHAEGFTLLQTLVSKIAVLPHALRLATMDVFSQACQSQHAEMFKLLQTLVSKIVVLPHDLRLAVTDVFILGSQGQNAELLEILQKDAGDTLIVQLACFILSEFPIEGKEVYTSVLQEIKSDRTFRNGKYQQFLLTALIALKNSSLDNASKITLLEKIFKAIPEGTPENRNSQIKERQDTIRLLIDILNFKGDAYLPEATDSTNMKSIVERLFAEKCKIKLDNFSTLYQNTVDTWRNKDALWTYAGKHVGNPNVLPYFQKFLTSVLQGEFQHSRYAIENNPHLAQIQKQTPDIFEKWKQSTELTEDEITLKETGKAVSIEKKVVETLKLAVENHHLGLAEQETYFPILSNCMGNWEQLEEPLQLIANKLVPLSNRVLSEDELQQRQQLQLQKAFLELIQDPSDLEKKLNNLKGIKIKGLDKMNSFYSELDDLVKLMRSSMKHKAEAYKVIETDDPNHFLLMGTEVLNSCQNVNDSASKNIAILGYALDGKHRLALVCDPNGKILARSVLRLLIDAEGKPVLFQEKMYVADGNPDYPQLLRKMALKKASLLGVPLVVSPNDFENEKAKSYPVAIEAKDKPVPFEYVDALAGLRSGGYKISNALHIK